MNSINSLISIIIPVYNRENVVEECINSVLAQSYQNFEIVIVDDGSSDNTYSICKFLAEKDPRIKLFKGEHGGVSAARNTALDKADGEYVFFLDSDDVIHPLLLETLVTEMVHTGALIGGTDVVNVSEKHWYKVKDNLANTDVGEPAYKTNEETLEALFYGKSPFGCIGGVMMSKALIADTKFSTDIYIGEDFYFIYQNLIKGASSIFLKQKWYYVRLHNNNSSWDYSFNGFYTRFYRRKLVWMSEQALGRTEYADLQKRDAFGVYCSCISKHATHNKECSKMQKVLKKHSKDILPVMKGKQKIVYVLYVYFPVILKLLLKLKKK